MTKKIDIAEEFQSLRFYLDEKFASKNNVSEYATKNDFNEIKEDLKDFVSRDDTGFILGDRRLKDLHETANSHHERLLDLEIKLAHLLGKTKNIVPKGSS